MSIFTRLALATALVAGVTSTHAAPVIGQGTWETTLKARDINGNVVALGSASAAFFYDTTLNVTWLANMNQDERKTWSNAVAWADALTTGGFTDWRLPIIIDSGTPGCNFSYSGGTDCGNNVQTQVGSAYSEWAHLYYVTLGNLSACVPGDAICAVFQSGWGMTNTAYFQNMLTTYWSGTEDRQGLAWHFNTSDGYQNVISKSYSTGAAAVRSGDVLRDPGTVPEPQSLALALTALVGLGVSLRRRRAA